MGQVSAKLRKTERGYAYWCQGCEELHAISVDPGWTFDGNLDRPTFSPSVLVTYCHSVPPVTPENLAEWRLAPWPQTKVTEICHTFITAGMVQFLSDCTHALAGQTLELPDLPPEFRDDR